MDLETQDHIFNYQLPVAIKRYNVGLVVIDSITSNYRAERTNTNISALSSRSTELAKLGHMLRNLAAKEEIALVLANQVSDRFEPIETVEDTAPRSAVPPALSQNAGVRELGTTSPRPRNRTELLEPATQQALPDEPPTSSPSSSQLHAPDDDQFDGTYVLGNAARNESMSLLHQERFFTGWGDSPWSATSTLKTPALGFFWSTQIACRIALKKEEKRSTVAPWDGAYPLSTPREQTDPSTQETGNGRLEHRSGFASARESQGEEKKIKPESKLPEDVQKPLAPPQLVQNSQKQDIPAESEYITKRIMKVVFAPWAGGLMEPPDESIHGTQGPRKQIRETNFEIWKGGLRSI